MNPPPPTTPARCVESSAAWSGAAALVTVSAQYGIPLTVAELAELTHSKGLKGVDEAGVLVLARALGFEAAAMEGGYGDLPDVVLPLLVALREGERDRYAVLFAFDDTNATVGDPITGEVSVWTRERFCALWTGSVAQVTPVDDERHVLAARLVDLRHPVKRVLRAIGWTPPYGPKIAMLAAWGAIAAVASVAPRASSGDATWIPLIALACAGSLWSWLGSSACARCGRARQLAGALPLAPAGAALYAALLASRFVAVPSAAVAVGMGAAVGVHAALVATLFREKLACGPCLFVAACVLGAAMVWLTGDDPQPVAFLAAAAVMGVVVQIVLPRARAREAALWRATAMGLAEAVFREPPSEDAKVRVVAYKRAYCGACAFFEAAVKPALKATFTEGVTLEERDIGSARTVAPIVILAGARRVVFVGLPVEDAPAKILDAVREALESEPSNDAKVTVHAAE